MSFIYFLLLLYVKAIKKIYVYRYMRKAPIISCGIELNNQRPSLNVVLSKPYRGLPERFMGINVYYKIGDMYKAYTNSLL
ncbi:MAG: hypothetical protein NZ893_01500 [Candidatus Aenigmarchaeota archaeon]|nr:hypothetical protein [Candidatus Aenigmarchaeota archaeon]